MTRGSIEEFLYNTSKKRLGKVSVRLPVLWEAFRSLRGASYHGGGRAYLTVSEEGAARLGEMSPDDKAAISRYDIQNAAPLLVEKYIELANKAGVKFGQ